MYWGSTFVLDYFNIYAYKQNNINNSLHLLNSDSVAGCENYYDPSFIDGKTETQRGEWLAQALMARKGWHGFWTQVQLTDGELLVAKRTLRTAATGQLVQQGRDSEWPPHTRWETAQRMCCQGQNLWHCVEGQEAWHQKDLGSCSSPSTSWLCDLRQVSSPLWASVCSFFRKERETTYLAGSCGQSVLWTWKRYVNCKVLSICCWNRH